MTIQFKKVDKSNTKADICNKKHTDMKISIPALWIFLLSSLSAGAQEAPLQEYIQAALSGNIALQKKELSYEKSLAALQESKALFFPRLSAQARYSVARGGRAFIIPVGDLMNPVYHNLNELNRLVQIAYPDYPTLPEYPMIDNVQENFLRETEQETVVRLQMPVFNNAILYNHRIRQNLSAAEKVSADIYRRELVQEVKVAYFNYAQAAQGAAILENALQLVEENLRTVESLHRNNKVAPDAVYGARAEVAKVEQQLAESEKNEKVARAYFNFLLNRDYEAAITLPAEASLPEMALSAEEARNLAIQNREEFQQLNYYLSASDNQVQLDKGSFLPQINIQADYGIQGVNYAVTGDSDFFLGSAVLSWNIFDPGRNARVQQSKIGKLELEKQRAELQQQAGLQAASAYYGLEAARKRIAQAQAEMEAARQAFRLVDKKFAQGQANLLEFTNARTQMTMAEQNSSIAYFDYQAKLAVFERATASYPFE